jgi:TetR/AcrR family transcriptional regulator
VSQSIDTLSAASPEPVAGAAVRRRPGRPSRRADTRALLMDAALRLFAQQGIPNTTLRLIAEQVGLTPAMAHYHFKSREQLIDALAEERLLPICIRIDAALDVEDDHPMAVISSFIQRLLEAMAECPWWAPLWVREVLSEGGALTKRVHNRLGEAGREKWERRVTLWKRQGLMNEGVDADLVFMTIMGFTLLPLAAGWNASDPVGRDRLARHVTTLLGRGLF